MILQILCGFLSVFLLSVLISILKKCFTQSTIDEELAEYEALLREREKKGIGMSSENKDIERHPIPILDSQEMSQLVLTNDQE